MFIVAGRRYAQASSASVGEVRRPPVIAKVAARCNVVSFLITVAEPVALGPEWPLWTGIHQRSTAYRALGSATLM